MKIHMQVLRLKACALHEYILLILLLTGRSKCSKSTRLKQVISESHESTSMNVIVVYFIKPRP